MGAVNVTTIKTAVKKHIDEVTSGSVIADDTALESIIEKKIVAAVNYVHRHAVLSYMKLDFAKNVSSSSGSTIVSVNDYCRFINASNSNWVHPVARPIVQGDPEWALAKDSNCGARNSRPAVLMELKGLVIPGITYSSPAVKFELLPGGGSVYYIPVASMGTGTPVTIDIDGNMMDAVEYQVAGEVLLTLGDERAKSMLEMAKVCMGVAESELRTTR